MTDPAPLYAIESAPVPAGGRAEWFEGAGGLSLRAAFFPSTASPSRGSVICSPGRAEPIEKYFEVIETLLGKGFTVLVHDWRGQGLSARLLPDRLKGHADGIEPFLEDYKRLLDHFADRLPRPWIGMGHSMGGCLTLAASARGETRLQALALCAPMLGIKVAQMPPLMMRTLTFLGSLTFPTASPGGQARDPVDEVFPTDSLTHDETRFRRYQQQLISFPDLRLGPVTWGWLRFALSACHWLANAPQVAQLKVPVLGVLAAEDQLIDVAAQRRTLARMAGAEIVEVAGAWHEVLIEEDPMRDQFFAGFDRLVARIERPDA